MHNDEDINLNLNPGDGGDGSPGGYYFFPAGPVDLTAADVAAQHRTMKLVPSLMDRLANDSVDMNYIIKAYQLVRDNHTTQKGKRRVPSDKGRELIIALYDKIADYRDDVMQTSDYGPYPSHTVYNLRCAMVDIIKMYDEYCAAIRDLIVPPTPQQPSTASSSGNMDLETKTSKSNATAKNDEAKGKKKEIFHIDNIDVEELSGYFKAQFKGMGGHFDYFSRLVGDMKQLTTQREMGMLAVMIRRCSYHIKKHKTFAGWFRAFCKIVGQPYPQDLRPNKYSPSELFQKRFYYLHSDFKVDKS